MPVTKILIVEDEDLIAEDMASKLAKIGYEITAYVDSCEKALESAKTNPPDIVFLDIAIAGDKDGIETAKLLKELDDFILIFLTNLDDEKTLKRALELKPANYLPKPFTEHQLHVSIQAALINLSEEKDIDATSNDDGDDLNAEDVTSIILKNKFFFKEGNGSLNAYDVSDILFMEAERSYCDIFLKGNKKLTQVGNMGSKQKKINHPLFVRVHRSYVVNIENIETIKNNGNTLILGGKEVPVSGQYKKDLFKLLTVVK